MIYQGGLILKKLFFIVSSIIVITVLLSACSSPNKNGVNGVNETVKEKVRVVNGYSSDYPHNRFLLTNVKVIDANTVQGKVEGVGELETFRLLLIHAPEVDHKELKTQPYGIEARRFARSFIEGDDKDVRIEFDSSGEVREKNGKLLAYLWVNGKLYNQRVVEEGFARVAFVYEPNTRHLERLERAEYIAQSEKKNIWENEGYVMENGYRSEEYIKWEQAQTEVDKAEKSKEEQVETRAIQDAARVERDELLRISQEEENKALQARKAMGVTTPSQSPPKPVSEEQEDVQKKE